MSDAASKTRFGNKLREIYNLNSILPIPNDKFIFKRGISEIIIGRYIIKNVIKTSAKKIYAKIYRLIKTYDKFYL